MKVIGPEPKECEESQRNLHQGKPGVLLLCFAQQITRLSWSSAQGLQSYLASFNYWPFVPQLATQLSNVINKSPDLETSHGTEGSGLL